MSKVIKKFSRYRYNDNFDVFLNNLNEQIILVKTISRTHQELQKNPLKIKPMS